MMGKMLELIRGIVRPVLTLTGFATVSLLVVKGTVSTTEYLVLVTSMVSFWFAGRSHPNNGEPPKPSGGP